MDREILVHVDLDGTVHPVGRLWSRIRNNRESATFEYERAWLTNPHRFSLEPALAVGPGPYHTTAGTALFGAIGDSVPDRWGRALMRRAERRRAQRDGATPRSLHEVDYLLAVSDHARQGALRFAERPGGPFLADHDHGAIPALVDLPRLLAAVDHVVDERESDDDLRLLLAPGSSLGGARPKAAVHDRDGRLALAKFPHRNDDIDIVRWEAVALSLADKAGVAVPNWRLETVAQRSVLISRRFDRAGDVRIPFLSGLSMLGARDHDTRSYLELVDVLRRFGAAPKADMEGLWRRLVLNVLISNTDDHLRNHGFLRPDQDGWRLAPAYDLNPVPIDIKPRALSTAIDLDDTTASLELAFAVADYFELTTARAREIAAEVGRVTANWRDEAARFDLNRSEIDRMASAFEHDDLKIALR